MNAPVSGVGPTQQPAQIVAPAIPEQRSVAQPNQAQRPSAQDMTQQAVQLFNGIFQLPPDLNYANGVTYEQVQGKVSKELFDLIANGMKTSNEVQGSDTTITADEISGFISNVALFMQMAQLDPNDPTELARVARLYNKNGGQYTRVNISDFQQIRGLIEQNWTTASATNPYEKAAQVVGNGAQAAQISPMLDMISRKLNRADYKDAQPEGQKSVLSAFLLASSLRIDISELYGDVSERPITTARTGVAEGEQPIRENIGQPLISAGEYGVIDSRMLEDVLRSALEISGKTNEQLESELSAITDERQKQAAALRMYMLMTMTRTEGGLVLTPKAIAQKVVTALCQQAMVSNLQVSEEEINKYFSENPSTDRNLPQNVEIAKAAIRQSKMENDALLIKEFGKIGLNVDAQKVADIVNAVLGGTEGTVTSAEVQKWVAESKNPAKASTNPAVPAYAGSSERSGRVSNSPVTDAKVSDAYVRAMAVERPEILDLESLRALNDAIAQLNENQYSAFVQRYEEMAAGLGDQKPHCGEFFKNKSKSQAIEAMNTVLASAQTEVAGSGIVMPEAETEEGPAETMATEQQADGVPDVPQQNTVAEEAPTQDVDDAATSPEQEETASVVADPKAETQESRVMGDIRQQLDKISKKFGEDWQSNIRQLERYYVALQEYIRQLNTDQYGLLSKECEGRLSGLPDDMGGSPLSILYSQLASASDPNEANNRITNLIGDLRGA